MRFCFILALTTTAFAQCSIESVHGTWALQHQGTMMIVPPGGSTANPVPFARLAIVKYDLTGGFTIDGMLNVGGTVQKVSGSGTIQVDPSCTAMDSYSIGDKKGSDRMVILGNGTEIRMLDTTGGTGGVALLRRLSWGDAQCTQDMLHGVYLGSSQGTVIAPIPPQKEPVPLPMSALFASVDEWGSASTVGTMSVLGYPQPYAIPRVTATVNPDCTGTSAAGNAVQFLIVLDNGNEMWMMPARYPAPPVIAITRMVRVSREAASPNW
jgi:hypothetical protein